MHPGSATVRLRFVQLAGGSLSLFIFLVAAIASVSAGAPLGFRRLGLPPDLKESSGVSCQPDVGPGSPGGRGGGREATEAGGGGRPTNKAGGGSESEERR